MVLLGTRASMTPIEESCPRDGRGALGLRAIDPQREDLQLFSEGMTLTLKSLLDALARFNIEPIDPAGQSFDPQLHQAMFEAPLPGTKAGQIIQVLTEGFLLHDRLLRPAQVGVSSNTAG